MCHGPHLRDATGPAHHPRGHHHRGPGIVLRLLPEVQTAGVKPSLPAVTALADRKSSSKSVKVARRIVDAN